MPRQPPIRHAHSKLLVGYPPGGGADILARIFANKFSRCLAKPVVIENRPAPARPSRPPPSQARRRTATRCSSPSPGILVGTTIYDKVGYDPLALTPIGALGNLPYSLVVNPGLSRNIVREFIDILKANPGKYSYATPGVGNIAHLSAEMFQKAAGVQIVHVPYKGGTPALGRPGQRPGPDLFRQPSAGVALAGAASYACWR